MARESVTVEFLGKKNWLQDTKTSRGGGGNRRLETEYSTEPPRKWVRLQYKKGEGQAKYGEEPKA